MDFIRFNHHEDFGHDFYIQILNIGRHVPRWMQRSLLQLSISWNDYPSWPYIQFTFGGSGLLGVIFWVYKFGFDFDILSYTWKLNYWKNTDEYT